MDICRSNGSMVHRILDFGFWILDLRFWIHLQSKTQIGEQGENFYQLPITNYPLPITYSNNRKYG